MRACTHVYLFVCFPVLRVCMLPKGKQAVWGVICFYRGWQLITNPDKHWGRGEGRERERWQTRGERKKGEIAQGRGIDIWIPQSNRRALWILSSPPPHGFGLELDHCAAAHLALWQLIDPHQYRYTQRWRAAEKTRDDFLMSCVNLCVCRICQQPLWFSYLLLVNFPASSRISAEGFTSCFYCRGRHLSCATFSGAKGISTYSIP